MPGVKTRMGVLHRCRHGGKAEGKSTTTCTHTDALVSLPGPQPRAGWYDEQRYPARGCLLTPCCPEAVRPPVITSPQGPSARVSGGAAWVESWRLILDLETPCQQLWLGCLGVVLRLFTGSPPHGLPGLLAGTHSCLCLSCWQGLGQGFLCMRVGP